MTTTSKIHQYVIGGSVRDILLGRKPKDIDYLWVGATPQHMLKLNMKPVGKDFPVFLDVDGNEHALARIERKIGVGYYGFECDYDTSVTLRDDQSRRDLTINQFAVPIEDWEKFAKTADESLVIDSFNGMEDLKNKILRQTTSAFEEDPLRVLRTARFAARYNFTIHPGTLDTMCNIVSDGEMDALPMERVFAEFKKVMMEDHYGIFFGVLNKVDAFDLYFDELCDWNNKGVDFAVQIGATFEERVCLLVMGLNATEVKRMLTRIKADKALLDMALWTVWVENVIWDAGCEFFGVATNKDVFNALDKINAWKNVHKMQKVARLFLFYGGAEVEVIEKIFTVARAGARVSFNDLDKADRDTLKGKEIGEAITKKRREAIEELNLFPS